MQKPEIRDYIDSDDFHDSNLLDIAIDHKLNEIVIVVATLDENKIEQKWEITFRGVLRFEYETLGSGLETIDNNLEIYEIYFDTTSNEYKRWHERLKTIEEIKNINLYHITLASSFIRGWGTNENLEGINIICREYTINKFNSKKEFKNL